MSTAVVFLAKPTVYPTAELNRKTRLAFGDEKKGIEGIGEIQSEEFCKQSIACLIRTFKDMGSDVTSFVAIGDEEAATTTDPEPLWENLQRLYTGEGGLGDRQHNIFEQLKNKGFDNVIITASDIPQLSAKTITNAITALDTNDVVFGKTAPQDGGYYLFGAKEPVDITVWNSVKYSQPTTATNLINAMVRAGNKVGILPEQLNGVNFPTDLPNMFSEMPRHPNPEQRQLITWFEELGKSAQRPSEGCSR